MSSEKGQQFLFEEGNEEPGCNEEEELLDGGDCDSIWGEDEPVNGGKSMSLSNLLS